jgi:hypothetical protein
MSSADSALYAMKVSISVNRLTVGLQKESTAPWNQVVNRPKFSTQSISGKIGG